MKSPSPRPPLDGDTRRIGYRSAALSEPLKNLSPTRTGNTREVKGYTCHEYVATGAGIHIVAWATEEVDTAELEAFAAGFPDEDPEPGIVPRLVVKGMVMSCPTP